MGDEAFSVTITPDDMYREIVGMRGDVQRLTIKLDGIIDATQDHETRIRTLEGADYVTEEDLRQRSNRTAAWSAAVAGIVAALVAVVTLLLSRR